ncbi:SipW-dependent-type signal peptide-containing protein [Microbacterium soli]|uniref:Ribosomally synthesized peptide with SipW-like signal peptide n=1 Tax=Microbacterium soli TaxID=446075 RepID=A0ABP7NEU7_9MICO
MDGREPVTQTRRGRRVSHNEQRRRTLLRARALLAAALVLGIGGTVTVAAWTDQEHATTTVTAGRFAIESRVSGTTWASNDTTAVTLPLAATDLYPNQSRAAWVQLRTAAGSVPGTVSLTAVQVALPADTAPHTDLRDALRVRAAPVADVGGCGPAAVLGPDVGITAVPPQSAQTLAGDGQSVVTYCIVVSLPATAVSTAQGGHVEATWTFTGTTDGVRP